MLASVICGNELSSRTVQVLQELLIGVDVIVGLDVIVEHRLTVGASKKNLNVKIGTFVDEANCRPAAVRVACHAVEVWDKDFEAKFEHGEWTAK